MIRKDSQPSNVADFTHPMRQAEAIEAGIKRPIAACAHALGRPAPAAIPREMD